MFVILCFKDICGRSQLFHIITNLNQDYLIITHTSSLNYVIVSETSPQWGDGWKKLVLSCKPYLVYIMSVYILVYIDVLYANNPGVHRRFYGLDSIK